MALLPHTTARPLFASNCCIPATVAIMATGDEDSSEREEVPFSLVPPHDMTRLVVENKNVAARGSDADRSDPESDNVSKDSGGDTIHHDNENNQTSLCSRASNYNENEILILAHAWVQVSTDPATGTDQKSAHFWNRVLIAYLKFIAITNNKYSKKDGEHTLCSLRIEQLNHSSCNVQHTFAYCFQIFSY